VKRSNESKLCARMVDSCLLAARAMKHGGLVTGDDYRIGGLVTQR
jgi:hypothetical protein